jgi:ATP-dependent Clp protease ATP-binding subunit ClpC
MFGDTKALSPARHVRNTWSGNNASRMVRLAAGYVDMRKAASSPSRSGGKPYSVVLFDEIEKAHPDGDEHASPDSGGGQTHRQRRARGKFPEHHHSPHLECGAETLRKGTSMGFAQATDDGIYEKMREKILDESQADLPARVPQPPRRRDCLPAAEQAGFDRDSRLEIQKVMTRLKGKNLQLNLDEKAKDFLVDKGYDPQYGARPMRRAVERHLEDPLAEEILKGSLHDAEMVFQVTVGKTTKPSSAQSQFPPGRGALLQLTRASATIKPPERIGIWSLPDACSGLFNNRSSGPPRGR